METKEKQLAERVLTHTLLGRNICGITFYAAPILIISENASSNPQNKLDEEVLLTIESEWEIIKPGLEAGGTNTQATYKSHNDVEGLAYSLAAVRSFPIIDVTLSDEYPHLAITFTDGTKLLISGEDDQYETWQLKTGDFLIVATPGGGLAIWTPKGFNY